MIWMVYNLIKSSSGKKFYSKLKFIYGITELTKLIIQNLNMLESKLDDSGENLEVRQLPFVKSLTDVMISQQEQEIILVHNIKRMENMILKDLEIGGKICSNQEANELESSIEIVRPG